ncbi:MAG: amidase [Deltaproteobacteria bacterium]|nr:amidase [Deltaproteobacteria bacterium]
MVALDSVAQRLLKNRRSGRLLTWVARAPVPVLGPDEMAARYPEPGFFQDSGPLVEVGRPRTAVAGGLLDGDVVIKDQIDVVGFATGVGMQSGGAMPERDATLVARIVAAGGRIVGKAKMTELGIDGIGAVMHYAMPANPRAPGYSPGGSSTGTAVAVATGLARYGVGGDGLGSIRIPAAFCGLVGLKPGRDRVPRDGIRSPVRTLDAVGPITRSVDDCARLWQVMAGETIETLAPWTPERVGIAIGSWLRPARSVERAFDRALAALAVGRQRVDIAGLDRVTFMGGMIGAHELATGPFAGEVHTRAGRTSRMLGNAISHADAARLYAQRDLLRAATARALERTPILAFPTTAIPPPALTDALVNGGPELRLLRALGAFTPLANLCDLPSIAVPCGVDDRGRPLSIMFVAASGQETALLRLALAVERTGLGTKPV